MHYREGPLRGTSKTGRNTVTRLFLIRHGETLSNIEQRYQGKTNSHLTELGIKESNLLAEALKNIPFKAVYSSTLDRSAETANIIAKPHGLKVTKIDGLKERDYGDWENLTFTDIKEKYSKIYEEWLKDPALAKIPGAESLKDLQKRGVKAIESIISKHGGETIAVVGHGGINRVILFHYMNLDIDNFWRIKQDNCCINIIEFNMIPIVLLLNSTFFLGEKRMKETGYY